MLASGVIGTPKSASGREIALGEEVHAALKANRHLRGELVFCAMDGSMLTSGEMKSPLWRACRRAALRRISWHVLRDQRDVRADRGHDVHDPRGGHARAH